MKLFICAIGRLKASPFEALFQFYYKRVFWPLQMEETELNSKLPREERQRQETNALFKKIPSQTEIIVLDERGANLSSEAFALRLKTAQDQSKNLAFIIGGAEGLSAEGREKAHHVISFGAATWPHLFVRVMLIEQLYRAQQILNHHPYHRAG